MAARPRMPILAVLLAVSAACTVGSGDLTLETRDVDSFDEIVLMTSGDVYVDVTGAESMEIEAEDNIIDLLTTDVVDRRLELGASEPFSTRRRITYRITAERLDGIRISGSGDVDIAGIDSSVFRAVVDGSGDITPSGVTDALTVTISGSGAFHGESLDASHAEVIISGSGDVTVDVSDTLDVVISGSGDVTYIGSPSVDQRISGSGDVNRG